MATIISREEFLQTVKVIRMLYGVAVATLYFEQNLDSFYGKSALEEFTGLQADVHSANV